MSSAPLADFIRTQMNLFADQVKDIGELYFKAAVDASKKIQANILNFHLVRSPTRRTCHDGELLNG
jgi:hypothetical protein